MTRVFALPIAAVASILHRRMGADPKRFSERLGRGALQSHAPVIWFHAASLGEVMQIAPLAQDLAQTENSAILVTTTTATGAAWVAREMPDAIHRFAPIDTPSAVACFLNGWSISAAIFVEGDLWPRLLSELGRRGIPRILLNARHSKTRARLPAVFSTLLMPFALVTCRSERVAEDIRALGLPAENIYVLPDLRLTVEKLKVPQDHLKELSQALGDRPMWLAASTHPADEDAILTAHQEVIKTFPDALLILAPRHPDRGPPLQKLAKTKTLVSARRSKGETLSDATQLYIADTLGELGIFFSLSPIVFLGGSFGDEGGHNPYEPAHFGAALVHGPHVKNFADAYDALHVAGAAVQVDAPEQLGPVLADLMKGGEAHGMAQAGLTFIADTQKSSATYAELITGVIRRCNSTDGAYDHR
ncbi:3-deoxy-D-manno-octulosonic acid transferase [Sulfitobacter guttiformis]|uniref:3-deoxy-D-manno-octulosonic acid transferase n=1 Tax=Sulfitobacter guttiformis TaxID=74349 RepID=UPI001472C1E2|nr:glycosyltransferase N-terminal domain-containing protein [Sulfitobacter guttiformis]